MVGHKPEGGEIEGVMLPLAITVARYAGGLSEGSLRACVEAVRLPRGALIDRPDLVVNRKPGRVDGPFGA